MRGDVGYFVQIALKSLGNLQRLGPEGILSFEQQKRLLPLRNRRSNSSVACAAASSPRPVARSPSRWELRRTVDASHGEDAKERDYPTCACSTRRKSRTRRGEVGTFIVGGMLKSLDTWALVPENV